MHGPGAKSHLIISKAIFTRQVIFFYFIFSLGETCSHVAAVLFKIEAAVRMGLTKMTPTDLPCRWNQNFTKNVLGCPVALINMYADKAKAKLNPNIVKKLTEPPPLEEFENFLSELKDIAPKAVGLSLFSAYQEPFVVAAESKTIETLKLPSPLRTLYKDSNIQLSENDYMLLAEATISDMKSTSMDQYLYVEEVTRNQSECFAWYEQRAGRITGSTAHSICHGSIDRPARSIVTKICSDKKTVINAEPLNHGKKHEHDALEIYKNASTNPDFMSNNLSLAPEIVHHDFELQSLGLVISDQTPWLAASPDGCVSCSCCGLGVVEIKCPYTLREKPLMDEIKSKNFYVKRNNDGTFYLCNDHEYFYQVQLEMYCTGTTYCDFIVWTFNEHLIFRVPRDNGFIDGLVITCSNYWGEVILKELLLRTMEKEDAAYATEAVTDEMRTCAKCNSKEGDMLKCGKCLLYFHPTCVGRKTLSKRFWACKDCRTKK